MKDFLMSSTLPYWVIFLLVIAAGILGLLGQRKQPTSGYVKTVTVLALTGTLLEIVVYSLLGGRSIWWCTSSDYGFFAKLLRAVPLFIFLLIQLAQVFIYQSLMTHYHGREFSVKSTLYALLGVIPVLLVLYVLLNLLGVESPTRDVIFYVLLILSLGGGVGWALYRNVRSAGGGPGLLFTGVSFFLLIGATVSLLLLLVALLQLFFQMLMVAAVVAGVVYIAAPTMNKGIASQPKSMPRYYDQDGQMHYTASSRDAANRSIQQRKENS